MISKSKPVVTGCGQSRYRCLKVDHCYQMFEFHQRSLFGNHSWSDAVHDSFEFCGRIFRNRSQIETASQPSLMASRVSLVSPLL